MTALSLRRLAVLCLVALPLAASATDVKFEQGSLIIPMQSAYQTECGAVAAYGLVYRLLQNGVNVYWAVKPNKGSHHRCRNNPPPITDPHYAKYIDGCDFEVAKDSGQPVSLLENMTGNLLAPFNTSSTTSLPNNTGEPGFTVGTSVKRLRYMGGPFIIDVQHAQKVIDLLSTTTPGPLSIFSAAPNGACVMGSHHYVRIHRANNAFIAPIARVMNEVPPPMALIKGRNTAPGYGSLQILRAYLKNAGLDYTGAGGTFNARGEIYDVLDQDTDDLKSSTAYPFGKINAPDPEDPDDTLYKVVWSPHWEPDLSDAPGFQSAMDNLARFIDRGNSMFSECASIWAFESAYTGGDSTYHNYNDYNAKARYMTGDVPMPSVTGVQSTGYWSLTSFAPTGQDCSDPNRVGDCYVYSNYSDLFSQKGDYLLRTVLGAVEGFRARPGAGGYRPGTTRLISTQSSTPAMHDWDFFVMRQKNNNRKKGNVLYLGGHDLRDSGAGTRLVLNTLLNLSFKPVSVETSRSEPVADVVYKPDGTVDSVRVLSGTFLNTPPQALFPERMNFQEVKAADWVFPYIEGRLRSIPVGNIANTLQEFDVGADWEATAKMPAPGARTVFTVLGTNQQGLHRVPFTRAQLQQATCRDDATTGRISSLCDLTEALGLDRNASGVSEFDADGNGSIDATVNATRLSDFKHMSEHFLQRVKGFCVAHDPADGTTADVMEPTPAQCDNRQFGEVRAALGGLDHASPAVVGPSPYLATTRPVVAYVGGLDGQLHAIYVRGTGPGFTPPTSGPGTELWAFIPKGQLSRLSTNNARVDLSPVVSDVFVDYEDKNGNGVLDADPALGERKTQVYRWRTILVSGSGRLGGELFALDVTDPMKPIILWDVTASSDKVDSDVPAENVAFRWSDREGTPPNYNALALAPKSGPYNYSDLGESLEINLVPVRRGNLPSFQLIVSTNGAGSGAQQLQVFGVDAGTGRKLWQWERPYSAGTSNSVPAGTSTLDVDGDGGRDRVYVGDMEGRLWELSFHTGVNLNYIANVGGTSDSYPLFFTDNAAHHPISTSPAIMRLPYSFGDGPFKDLEKGAAGKLALVFGTAGNDWVLSKDAEVKGRVYVVAAHPEDIRVRHHLTYDKVNKVPTALATKMDLHGTVKKPEASEPGAALSYELAEQERAVGALKIVGGKIVLTTTYGTTENDPFSTNMKGRTHVLDLNASSGAKAVAVSGKSAAGGLVLPDGSLVVQSMTGIQKVLAADALGANGVPKAGLPGRRTPARVGAWMDLGRSLAE
jgi:type IV pilus assembly protein PilY1